MVNMDLDDDTPWGGGSPLTLVDPISLLKGLENEGPVTYVLVSGYRDNDWWGSIGALWLSENHERGGFLVHPDALWAGSEMVRNHRSALERGWTQSDIYDYWRHAGTVALERQVDTVQRRASTLRDLWETLNLL